MSEATPEHRPEHAAAASALSGEAVIAALARVDRFMHAVAPPGGTPARFDVTLRELVAALRETLSADHVTLWVPHLSAVRLHPETNEPEVLPAAFGQLATTLRHQPLAPATVVAEGTREMRVLEERRAWLGDLDGAEAAPAGAEALRAHGLERAWVVPIPGASLDFRTPGNIIAIGTLGFRRGGQAEHQAGALVEFCGRVVGRLLERALWAEQDLVIQRIYEAASLLDEDQFVEMDAVARTIATTLHFEACTILLADDRARTLHILGTTGIESRTPRRKMVYPYGFSCTGWVAVQRRTLATEDVEALSVRQGPKFPDKTRTPEMHQFLATPVTMRDRSRAELLLGVIRLRNKLAPEGDGFPRVLTGLDELRVMRLARVLAPLLSLLLENKRNAETLERVRHDMDMPATMIRDSAGILRRKPQESLLHDIEEVQRRLEDIESLAEILMANSELLGLHTPADLRLEPEHVLPLGQFVAKLCKMLTPAARRKKLAGILYNDGSFGAIPRLWLDPKLMQIALYNLLQNAVKYSDAGEIIAVEGEAERRDGQLWYSIHVKNTGLGVHPEEARRIFEKHYRSPRALKRASGGLGIGLSTARALVERHGGHLVLTKAHQPTIFTIQLPSWLAERPPT